MSSALSALRVVALGTVFLLFGAAAGAQQIAPPPQLELFVGKPVTRVDVVLDDETWADVVAPRVMGVKAGESFDAAVARRALSEVLDSGRFAQGRVVVAADGAGVRLVVHVIPRKLIELLRVNLHGASVERDEVLREADLSDGGEILGPSLAAQEKKVEALFARNGYPMAKASITTRATDDPSRVLTFLDVQPGSPRILDRRVFYIFHGDDAAAAVPKPGTHPEADRLKATAEDYVVKGNQRADESALEAADTKLETVLRAKGYHHADVSHDVIVFEGRVTLRVRVDAGPQFFPRFTGNERFDEDALSGALGLEEETDRSAGHLVQKLKDFYAKRGYLDAEVTMEARGTDQDRVHFLVFKIVEHPRVIVASRAYPCLKEIDIKRLKDGGPTSAAGIGSEIDSYLEEELPGSDIVRDPNPAVVDKVVGGSNDGIGQGARPAPVELDPNATYVADTYERAALHVQELYRNEGFLHAQVGPVSVVRRTCDRRSPPGKCLALRPPSQPPEACAYDANNLPLPVPPLDPVLSCVPDPAHGVECEPRVALRIPVKLGPRTTLYDLSFQGVRALAETKLAAAAKLTLGDPANTLKLDEARRRIVELYKEEGYAYVDVKYTLDSSVDNTRARARFEVSEGEQVIVKDIVIRGNTLTHEWTIRRRMALDIGKPYRTSDVRKTQERIATLNVFTSVTVALAEPYVPQKNKTVLVTVVERLPQYLEIRPGFSTGEGLRMAFEYGQRNFFGDAIGFTFRAQLSYLPTPLILDPQVRKNFTSLGEPGFDKRIAARVTGGLIFPEIGLGPLVRTGLDGVFVHDLQRDFFITKIAVIPSVNYRPIREVQLTLSQSVEDNYVKLFQFDTINQYLNAQAEARGGPVSADLAKYLLVPDGASFASAQRLVVAWDRRDNSFNASRGTYFVSGLEHVDDFPVFKRADDLTTFEGHFLRFTETFAGYIPLPRGMRIAAELRVGTNVQLTKTSQTYPDRLFFMGGVESMRGWQLSSFVPQDDIDRIDADSGKPDCVVGTVGAPCGTSGAVANPDKFTISSQPVRGGNLMVNPRLELRIPISSPVETALFTDVGNLWRRASYPLDTGKFPIRASVGAGLRIQTPVGPLALDYGINVTRHSSYEDFGALHFAIGLF